MEKAVLKINNSINYKFVFEDLTGHTIIKIRNKFLSDFWNTFLGWILSMPSSYKFEIDDLEINLKRELSPFSIRFRGQSYTRQNHVSLNSVSVLINNPAFKKKDFIKINNVEYELFRAARGIYFSVFDPSTKSKYLVIQRDARHKDTYHLVYDDNHFSQDITILMSMSIVDSI